MEIVVFVQDFKLQASSFKLQLCLSLRLRPEEEHSSLPLAGSCSSPLSPRFLPMLGPHVPLPCTIVCPQTCLLSAHHLHAVCVLSVCHLSILHATSLPALPSPP